VGTRSWGRITTCRTGACAVYVLGKGHVFTDRALHPKAGADDPARRAAAPGRLEIVFATKPPRARALAERAVAAAVAFARAVGDSSATASRGVSGIDPALRRAGQGHGLGVKGTGRSIPGAPSPWLPEPRPRPPARSIPPPGRLRPGPAVQASGYSRGPLWNGPVLKPPHTTRACPAGGPGAGWSAATSRRRGGLFTPWCPAGTPGAGPVGVAEQRRAIEDGSRRPQTSLASTTTRPPGMAGIGMAGRRKAGRHPQGQHRRAPTKAPADDPQAPALIRWPVQEIRRVATRLAQPRIPPAAVIAGSLRHRAHQAAAQKPPINPKS